MKIHPVINNRTKNRFQFAPEIVCTGVQEIEIKEMIMTDFYTSWKTKDGRVWVIEIDGIRLKRNHISQFAQNDGFESVEQFFAYFNKPVEGQIIHWTDLKY